MCANRASQAMTRVFCKWLTETLWTAINIMGVLVWWDGIEILLGMQGRNIRRRSVISLRPPRDWTHVKTDRWTYLNPCNRFAFTISVATGHNRYCIIIIRNKSYVSPAGIIFPFAYVHLLKDPLIAVESNFRIRTRCSCALDLNNIHLFWLWK